MTKQIQTNLEIFRESKINLDIYLDIFRANLGLFRYIQTREIQIFLDIFSHIQKYLDKTNLDIFRYIQNNLDIFRDIQTKQIQINLDIFRDSKYIFRYIQSKLYIIQIYLEIFRVY